jgi:hypothetical protein
MLHILDIPDPLKLRSEKMRPLAFMSIKSPGGSLGVLACCIAALLSPGFCLAWTMPRTPLGIHEQIEKPQINEKAKSDIYFAPGRLFCQKDRSAGTTRGGSQETSMGITTSGSGKSRDDPLVIKGAPNRASAVRYEYTRIFEDFGKDTRIRQQALLKYNNRRIDVILFRSPDGADHEIYFDITDYFHVGKKERSVK